MATLSPTLTVPEFEAQYGREKPYYEYWYGEAVQKSASSWIHGFLQIILGQLLLQAGYKTGSEVKLKIDPGFHPVPDIIATKGHLETPYPTQPIEIVIEILSNDDPMSRLLTKCRAYQKWGIEQIYVIDPTARLIYRWTNHSLQEVDQIAGQPTAAIWTALDQALT